MRGASSRSWTAVRADGKKQQLRPIWEAWRRGAEVEAPPKAVLTAEQVRDSAGIFPSTFILPATLSRQVRPPAVMTLRAKFCVIGSRAGGGILAYRLAAAGEDVILLNSGIVSAPSVFKNELSPEQQGHFGIHRDTRFPIKPGVVLHHPLFAESDDKSSTSASETGF